MPKGSFFVGARFQAWGRGALPRRQVVPFGPSQGGPCEVGPGAPEPPVGRTLRVVGALTRPRGAAPRCPPTRRGPHFSREMGGKRAGGKPPGPPFSMPTRSRSFPLLRWEAQRGRYTGSYDALFWPLIWGLSFFGKFFWSRFFCEKILLQISIPEKERIQIRVRRKGPK